VSEDTIFKAPPVVAVVGATGHTAHFVISSSAELYPPAELLAYVNDRWTPELGMDVLGRTITSRSIVS